MGFQSTQSARMMNAILPHLGGNVRRLHASSCCRRSLSSSTPARADETVEPLIELEDAHLGYPNSTKAHGPWNFSVQPPTTGGHVLLGRNGSGKSLISNTLSARGSPNYLRRGSFYADKYTAYSSGIAHVSFESHEHLLATGGTVYKIIAGGGNLSKAAQFLVVRFGLFPLLHRDVDTLSTGEIRKTMLVRALATRPRLLILDNAFDGLDVESRDKLKELIAKTIRGFRPDILVQAVSAKATAHTQVLLMTHRGEEIVDEIETMTMWENGKLSTYWRDGKSGLELLERALGVSETHLSSEPWNDDTLPSHNEISAYWRKRERTKERNKVLVDARGLFVMRGEAVLLKNLNWTVKQGERWLVAGGNGAGKSTLSRLLAKDEGGISDGSLDVFTSGPPHDVRRNGVGWVSTELHMACARRHQSKSVADLFQSENVSEEDARQVLAWLELDASILSVPFAQLSQGQQKLVLIATALSSTPDVLVLDEPCQGLDLLNRNRVLGLCERVCKATDLSLVYITHHLEELLPCVTNVLHLVGGEAVYSGTREDYDPKSL